MFLKSLKCFLANSKSEDMFNIKFDLKRNWIQVINPLEFLGGSCLFIKFSPFNFWFLLVFINFSHAYWQLERIFQQVHFRLIILQKLTGTILFAFSGISLNSSTHSYPFKFLWTLAENWCKKPMLFSGCYSLISLLRFWLSLSKEFPAN